MIYRSHTLVDRVLEKKNRSEWLTPEATLRDRTILSIVQFLRHAQEYLMSKLDVCLWRSGDGKLHRVIDMERSHLSNVIRMINRTAVEADFSAYERRRYAQLHSALRNFSRRKQRRPMRPELMPEGEADAGND